MDDNFEFDDSTTRDSLDALDGDDAPDESRRVEPRVPLSAVHKERARIRGIQDRLNQLETGWKDVQNRLHQQQAVQAMQAAQAAQRQAESEQEPEPSFDLDPGEFLRRQGERLNEEVRQLKWAEANRAQQAQQAAAYGQAVAKVAAMEDQFRAEHPDYDDAISFLRTRRDEDLASWGMSDPAEREGVVRNEIQFLTDRALRLGENPAHAAFAMAQRWGFGQQGAASARSGKGKPDAMARLEAVRRGQRQAASLGSGGGLPPRVSAEARDLLHMDGPSFDEHWRRVFGTSDIF
jgi:hypothetical protein